MNFCGSVLSKLAALTPGEWALLIPLALFTMVAGVALRVMSLPRLVRLAAAGARLVPCRGQRESARLAELADMAAWAARGTGRCLARSLALFCLLRARGDSARLKIGVRRAEGQLEGHAWIEGEGQETESRFAAVLTL